MTDPINTDELKKLLKELNERGIEQHGQTSPADNDSQYRVGVGAGMANASVDVAEKLVEMSDEYEEEEIDADGFEAVLRDIHREGNKKYKQCTDTNEDQPYKRGVGSGMVAVSAELAEHFDIDLSGDS